MQAALLQAFVPMLTWEEHLERGQFMVTVIYDNAARYARRRGELPRDGCTVDRAHVKRSSTARPQPLANRTPSKSNQRAVRHASTRRCC